MMEVAAMSHHRSSRTATVGMMLGVLLAFASFATADDADKSGQVTSTFAVTGMT